MATRPSKRRAGGVPSGIYADHKGQLYSVAGDARDHATGENYVVLERLSDLQTQHCPLAEFNGHIHAFGMRYRRFTPADPLNLFVLNAGQLLDVGFNA